MSYCLLPAWVETVARFAALTPRQQEVAVLIAQGYKRPGIALQLCVESETVRNHTHEVLTAFGLTGPSARPVLAALLLNAADAVVSSEAMRHAY